MAIPQQKEVQLVHSLLALIRIEWNRSKHTGKERLDSGETILPFFSVLPFGHS